MLKIKEFHKDGTKVDLKELEKFGFRRHKQDSDDTLTSKWSREWCEADSIDGHKCGSDGWEFYPLIVVKNNFEVKYGSYWDWHIKEADTIIDDLIQADLVEKVEE